MVGFIQGAVNDGAEILCGGKIPKLDSKLDKGYFLEPTILGGQYYLNVVEAGVRKVRKPQNRTEIRQKPQTASVFFSQIPKPHVHGGHNMKADVSKTCKLI